MLIKIYTTLLTSSKLALEIIIEEIKADLKTYNSLRNINWKIVKLTMTSYLIIQLNLLYCRNEFEGRGVMILGHQSLTVKQIHVMKLSS